MTEPSPLPPVDPLATVQLMVEAVPPSTCEFTETVRSVNGPDVLFNDPGQTRFALLIDNGGTPTNPSDDQEPEFLGVVKGSTGRNDLADHDFSVDLQEFIG